jgi:hypothetical protein
VFLDNRRENPGPPMKELEEGKGELGEGDAREEKGEGSDGEGGG